MTKDEAGWEVYTKKKKVKVEGSGRGLGTKNLTEKEKKEIAANKRPVGRKSDLAKAADPETMHQGGVKQIKLNFQPAKKITRRDEKSKSRSPKRKQPARNEREVAGNSVSKV